MKTIGILGGLGPASTAAFYEAIAQEYFALRHDYAYPEMIIYSVNFQKYIAQGYEAPADVCAALAALARAGADFAVAACNSIHIVYDEVRGQTALPWLSIMDTVAAEIRRARMTRVGLLGTVFTMTSGFYQKALARHGIETLVPETTAAAEINRIIYDELITATIHPASRRHGLACIEALRARGAKGVILGCTELPFLLRQEDTDLPLFDTTALHARAALRLALDEDNGGVPGSP